MNEKATEPRKDNYGMFIRGICNGFRQYTRKKTGEIITQLLVSVPGATSSLQIELLNDSDRAKFQEFEPCAVKVVPSFYEGRIIGFNLA